MGHNRDRYLATLVSGYVLMATQIALSLATVPLALFYLGKETFGIWSLAAQVSAWLQLLDAGMNGALARHLIDYRTDPDKQLLENCIASGFRVLTLQGLLILTLALALSTFIGPAFGLNPVESQTFGHVLIMLGTAACLGFTSKIAQSWLYASQRLDICNFVTLGLVGGELLIFWLLLRRGNGIYSLAWARIFATSVSSLLIWWAAIKLTGFPSAMLWSKWDGPMLRKLASFGGGMFLLTLGTQLLTMTQTAMVTKSLGLATAAVWATAPKLFQVVLQMVTKLWDYRIPHLSTLMAERQTARLIRDFQALFKATAYIGGGGLGAVVALNPQFLAIWTHNTIHWNHLNDGLIALVFYISLLIRCITDFVLHTKKVGWMPVLMFCEGVLFVGSAMWMLPRFGIPGMLASSLVAGGVLRLPYAWRHFKNYLSLDSQTVRRLAFQACGGAILGLAIHTLLVAVGRGLSIQSDLVTLCIQSVVGGMLLGPLAWKLVIVSQRPAKV